MPNCHVRTDGLARRRTRLSGEVSADQLKREIDVAHRAWCERRGIGQWAPDPVFNRAKINDQAEAAPVSKNHRGGRRLGDVLCPKLHEIAQVIVAMGKPPRGTMRTLATRHGLSYGSLASMVSALRRARRQKEQAA